ncbi:MULTISPECIES: protein disulfide oxidoreductase [Thiorhodovibrio]|uniref:protein disulfide oxidoreductase n=1 Tax=Thiorhodovibrio TaxID=61593 RepID=UPI001F5C8FC9|nr:MULTISPECIES: protein disulfide oxidoreductase [Thiorhodovibrio]WPL12786.1 Cytochrome c biogenesis protein CcmG [Thiorhodovibrio litoralis]
MQEKASPRWRRWAIDLAVVVAIVLAVQWWQARSLASGMAPPLAGVDANGDWLDVAALRGEPVLVHFWGTWCPVCRLMDGTVARIAEDHAVVSVALQSGSAPEVRAYLEEHALELPAVLDPDGRLARDWGVSGVPANFVLDAEGRIRFATRGASSGPGLRVRLWLAGLSD